MIACGLFYTQVIRGQYYYNLSVNNRIRLVPVEGRRGRILDRNGVVLAENRMAFTVSIVPQDLKSSERLFKFLSDTLKIKKTKLLERYQQRKITPFAPVAVAEGVDKTAAMVLEESRFQFPGLIIEPALQRHYPFQTTGAHILGYVGKIDLEKAEKLKEYGYTYLSIIGKTGVEEYYDSYLKGNTGGVQIEVNSRGQQVRLLSVKQPANGQDLQLTIDQRVQQIASDVLADRAGAVVIMNLDSGELLGMVSSPSFDPNVFVESSAGLSPGSYFTNRAAPLLNRAIAGQYPPGSVFKTIVTIAGLASEKISPQTTFNCNGVFVLGRARFHCLHVHGPQNLMQAITHSCNVYFYNVGDRVGAELLDKYSRMFGLGGLTEVDLPGESKGNVPSPLQRKTKQKRGWFRGDTINYSIGQGDLLTTPLQIARMMATIARHGREVQPYLIKSIGDQEIVKFSTVRNVNIDPKIYAILQAGFRAVVGDSTGTARTLEIEGLDAAGKTGTAQTTKGKDTHAWFAGYTTRGKTRLAFCVFLEYGGSSYHAVVATREILLRMQAEDII